MEHYEEALDDTGVENEINVISEEQIKHTRFVKQVFSSFWAVIVNTFTSPVAIPMTLAMIYIGLPIIVAIFLLGLCFATITATFVATGIACVGVAVCSIVYNFTSSLFYFGAGLSLIGIGIMFGLLVIALSKKVLNVMIKIIRKYLPRRLQNAKI
jgi:hypothetical protein